MRLLQHQSTLGHVAILTNIHYYLVQRRINYLKYNFKPIPPFQARIEFIRLHRIVRAKLTHQMPKVTLAHITHKPLIGLGVQVYCVSESVAEKKVAENQIGRQLNATIVQDHVHSSSRTILLLF